MIFSKDKWKDEGVQRLVHASNALSFETLEGPLNQAWITFLLPLLGIDLCDYLEEVFASPVGERKRVDQTLLTMAQNALVNIALWHSYDEINVRLTDQGHQRQETENFKSVFRYQEEKLRNGYRNKGFNAIDAMLDYLERKGVANFPAWASAPANERRVRSVVKSPSEVNEVVFINNSAIVYLRLCPILRHIEDTVLPVRLGQKLYDEFMAHHNEPKYEIGSTLMSELRWRVVKMVVCMAVAELIRQTGSLTDRGLYFDGMTEGDGNLTSSPASEGEMKKSAAVYDHMANDYYMQLSNFIEYRIPDMYQGHECDVLKRDNDGKKSVWL